MRVGALTNEGAAPQRESPRVAPRASVVTSDARAETQLRMLVLGLTALRSRAAGRPAVRMDQGVTAPDDDDADLLKRMAQQRLLGKTETLAMLRLLRHL